MTLTTTHAPIPNNIAVLGRMITVFITVGGAIWFGYIRDDIYIATGIFGLLSLIEGAALVLMALYGDECSERHSEWMMTGVLVLICTVACLSLMAIRVGYLAF